MAILTGIPPTPSDTPLQPVIVRGFGTRGVRWARRSRRPDRDWHRKRPDHDLVAAVVIFDPSDEGACEAAHRWLTGPETPQYLAVVLTPRPVDHPPVPDGTILRCVVASGTEVTGVARVLAELLNDNAGMWNCVEAVDVASLLTDRPFARVGIARGLAGAALTLTVLAAQRAGLPHAAGASRRARARSTSQRSIPEQLRAIAGPERDAPLGVATHVASTAGLMMPELSEVAALTEHLAGEPAEILWAQSAGGRVATLVRVLVVQQKAEQA